MTEGEDRFRRAISAFDDANAGDPSHTVLEGESVPDELLYARRMSAWLDRLEPNAPEALRLAVRCQHLCRWMIPRDSYPPTRVGYLEWRTALGKFHADKAGEILRRVGYDEATVSRVGSLVRKIGIKTDADAQTLEDVACLVFLEHYFRDFAARHDEAKVVNIVARTWRKMSDRGRAAALGLPLSEKELSLVRKALSQGPPARQGQDDRGDGEGH